MRVEGRILRSDIPIIRVSRTSKYAEIVEELKNTSPDEALMLDISDEQRPKSAAQRIVGTIRRHAKGHIQGKIRSRFDPQRNKLYIWLQD